MGVNFAYDKQVGQRIRFLRERKGLTQEQLAARLQVCGCDVTRSALAKMEVGQRHIYASELRCLCEVLSTTYDELLP